MSALWRGVGYAGPRRTLWLLSSVVSARKAGGRLAVLVDQFTAVLFGADAVTNAEAVMTSRWPISAPAASDSRTGHSSPAAVSASHDSPRRALG